MAACNSSSTRPRFVAARESCEFCVMSFDLKFKTTGPQSNWSEIWHLWTVIVPRRSINGQLVYGKVWRRHDGRDWIYKKFTEFDGEEAA
jgi:hypothetical protein